MYREASLKAVMLRFDMEPLLGGQSLQIACGKEVEHPQENALESAVCAPGSGRPVVRKSAASGRLSGRESRRGSDCVALNPQPKAFESADDRAFAGGVESDEEKKAKEEWKKFLKYDGSAPDNR